MNESFSGLIEVWDEDHEFTFGKYKGQTIGEVLEENPGYIVWCKENFKSFPVSQDILDEAEEMAEERKSRKPLSKNSMAYKFIGLEPDDDIPF